MREGPAPPAGASTGLLTVSILPFPGAPAVPVKVRGSVKLRAILSTAPTSPEPGRGWQTRPSRRGAHGVECVPIWTRDQPGSAPGKALGAALDPGRRAGLPHSPGELEPFHRHSHASPPAPASASRVQGRGAQDVFAKRMKSQNSIQVTGLERRTEDARAAAGELLPLPSLRFPAPLRGQGQLPTCGPAARLWGGWGGRQGCDLARELQSTGSWATQAPSPHAPRPSGSARGEPWARAEAPARLHLFPPQLPQLHVIPSSMQRPSCTASHFRPLKDTAHALSQDGTRVRERAGGQCGARRMGRAALSEDGHFHGHHPGQEGAGGGRRGPRPRPSAKLGNPRLRPPGRLVVCVWGSEAGEQHRPP